MQTSKEFKKVIEAHLQSLADKDPLFAETYKKPAKNIEDCCTYILNRVKAENNMGYADSEVFGMAVHYYDEDDIKVGQPISARVVVNHHVDLSAEEKEAAHKAAMDRAIALEQQRITKKPVKKAEPNTSQPSLF